MQKRKKELGYINSPEARKKLSESLKGRNFTEEHRKKISESNKIYWQDPEIRAKRSRTQKGEKHWNYGKHRSEETKKKISEGNKIKWQDQKYRKKHIGENSSNWNPNREEVYAPYGENFYNNNIRNRKWKFQNGRDMLTGTKLDPNKRPAYHHIDYSKSNDNPDNHCFLSINNHTRITTRRSNPIKLERYKKILQENTLALKNGEIPKYWSRINKELFRQEKLKQLNLSIYIKKESGIIYE